MTGAEVAGVVVVGVVVTAVPGCSSTSVGGESGKVVAEGGGAGVAVSTGVAVSAGA